MSPQRVLSEEELSEQIRISAKKEILAVLKDGVPRSKKFEDAVDNLKIAVTELQLRQAARNNYVRLLQMLPAKERLAEIDRIKKIMLPPADATSK